MFYSQVWGMKYNVERNKLNKQIITEKIFKTFKKPTKVHLKYGSIKQWDKSCWGAFF